MSDLRKRSSTAPTTPISTQSSLFKYKPIKSLSNPLFFISHVLRVVAGILYICLTVPLLWVVLPLRPLNPFLRKIGIGNSKLPLDLVQKFWAKGMLTVLGVKVVTEGEENVDPEASVVLLYSHASSLDAFVIMGWSPVAVKFVFKSSLLYTAWFIFPLGWLYGHIPINRSNRESAIHSLENAGKKIKKYNRSVCIAPEGTRSPTGQLQEFKRGPFYLTKSADVPIIPAVMFNNFDLWPPGQIFPFSGEVRLRFLSKIVPTPEDTVDSISQKVHDAMEEGLKNVPTIKNRETYDNMWFAIIFLLAILYAAFRIFS